MKMSLTSKKILSFLLLAGVFSMPFLVGAQFEPGRGQVGSGLTDRSVYDILITVMKWMLLIITIVAVLGFIISGLMFILSGGNSDRQTSAKSWLTYSIIGIVVALIGYIIVTLVDNLLKGSGQATGA